MNDAKWKEIKRIIEKLAENRAEEIMKNAPIHVYAYGRIIDMDNCFLRDGEYFISLDDMDIGKAKIEVEGLDRTVAEQERNSKYYCETPNVHISRKGEE